MVSDSVRKTGTAPARNGFGDMASDKNELVKGARNLLNEGAKKEDDFIETVKFNPVNYYSFNLIFPLYSSNDEHDGLSKYWFRARY